MAKKKIVKHTYNRPAKYAERKDKGIPRGLTVNTRRELASLGTPLSEYIIAMNLKFDTVAAGFGIGVHALRKWLYLGFEPRHGIMKATKFIASKVNEPEMKIEAKLFSAKKPRI